ncbi:MAG TPA: polyprenyl synthetase family protein [Clostridiales bacterium]|jgi:geranylgeranyl diphosphate synthase type II|nr:polyprenyl synthetase family protein [Clostridiales bacterium]
MVILWDGFEKDFREFEQYQKLYFLEHFGSDDFSNITGYSLIDIGGKRIRPLLLIKIAQCSNATDIETAYKLGIALECIHTYSLIHDDLPCMDNDKYRRGFLSAHAKYGEALAILSGDALLNFAYETILDNDLSQTHILNAARLISRFAGNKGMIKGQVLDMDLTKDKSPDQKQNIYDIYLNKTAALFRAAINAGAILGNVSDNELKCLDSFAQNFGIYYQILDDINDFESEEDKLTYPKIFGLEQALSMAQEYKKQAQNCLKDLENKYHFLEQFLSKLKF